MLCFECAPDIETELAAAQVQTTVDQMRSRPQAQDLTKGLNLTAEAAALCPLRRADSGIEVLSGVRQTAAPEERVRPLRHEVRGRLEVLPGGREQSRVGAEPPSMPSYIGRFHYLDESGATLARGLAS
jgi:hypothetical protein